MEKFKLPESIKGQRLIMLQRTHEHDAEMWEAIEESRQEIREYLFWVDATKTYKDVVATTDMFFKKWDDDDEWAYDLYSLEENRLLGSIGAHAINFMHQKAEIGYWLRTSETDKGYMQEAVGLMEDALFKAGLHRIEILCDINNIKSANVAKRCGYKLESIAQEAVYHYTGLHDLAIYVKLSPYPIVGF